MQGDENAKDDEQIDVASGGRAGDLDRADERASLIGKERGESFLSCPHGYPSVTGACEH